MANQHQVKTFHADFASVTVCVDGMPIALHAEVDVTIKQPSKLSDTDRRAWEQLKSSKNLAVTAHTIPGER